jgi:hypothetical protein
MVIRTVASVNFGLPLTPEQIACSLKIEFIHPGTQPIIGLVGNRSRLPKTALWRYLDVLLDETNRKPVWCIERDIWLSAHTISN